MFKKPLKKKSRTARSLPDRGQLAHLTSRGYRRIIDEALHTVASPVTHPDPDTIDPIALEVSILLATLRNQGHAR